MAIDGGMLHLIKKELEEQIVGGRVEKITQPGTDELLIVFRTLKGPVRVIFSANPSDARVHITQEARENPKVPPMLCMLLRKVLGGARLVGIDQPDLERVLLFRFEGYNEIGDPVAPRLAVEIMGRYSNLILVDTENRVIDAVRRVDATLSGKRLVLPGVPYQLPPPQEKINILSTETEHIIRRIEAGAGTLQKELMRTMQGLCPLMSREIAFGVDPLQRSVREFTQGDFACLGDRLDLLRDQLEKIPPVYTMAVGEDGRPIDFTYQEIKQYGTAAKTMSFPTAGALLDRFFTQRDSVQRIKNRSGELYKLLQNTIARLKRKIAAQEQDLLATEDRDELRQKGDIISAYPYMLQKGMESVELENFYTGQTEKIQLDPALTPVQNAQRYYGLYKKACGAYAHLTQLLEESKKELQYIESVFEFLHHADTEEALSDLRGELEETGYVRAKGKKKQKKPRKAKPMEFYSSDGNRILVGRNNRQNEELSLHMARGNDMWFHAKNSPGSHVIAFDDGKGISDRTIEEAAMLAAYYSRSAGSNQIPVDYIWAKEIKKPQGGRPGMVIYHTNYTLYTTPDETLIEKMRQKNSEKND